MSNHKTRIIGGKFRSRVIKTPSCDKGVRPTTDALRELIFNVLEHSLYIDLDEFEAIDICAGSGALGLESISRGTSFCRFIDNNPISIKCIYENISSLSIEDLCSVIPRNISSINVEKLIQKKTIAFIDPPYSNKSLIKKILGDLLKTKKEIICVIESDEELSFIKSDLIKSHGKSVVSFLKIRHTQN